MDELYLAGSAPLRDGTLYVARHLPGDFLERYAEIEAQTDIYQQQKQYLRAYKRELLAGAGADHAASAVHDRPGWRCFFRSR